jgi:hypothetical protein
VIFFSFCLFFTNLKKFKMKTKTLNNEFLKSCQINANEMKSIAGGWTTEELIQMMWDATPDGCNSTWHPLDANGDGWIGYNWGPDPCGWL